MENHTSLWLDQIVAALADARAMLGAFGVHQPALANQIDLALRRAEALKRRALRS
jgi:hypothetical protein